MKGKLILLIILFLTIPIAFGSEDNISDENTIEIANEDVIGDLSNVYYFDASAAGDGVGSKSSPYKYLTSSRL